MPTQLSKVSSKFGTKTSFNQIMLNFSIKQYPQTNRFAQSKLAHPWFLCYLRNKQWKIVLTTFAARMVIFSSIHPSNTNYWVLFLFYLLRLKINLQISIVNHQNTYILLNYSVSFNSRSYQRYVPIKPPPPHWN